METLSIVVMNWRDVHNPNAGGAEVFTQEVASRWARRGNDVSLLTSRYVGSSEQEVIGGVKVRRQGTRFTVYHEVRQAYLKSYRGRADVVLDEINTIPFFTPRYVKDRTQVFCLIHQLAREGWFYETPFPLALLGRYLLEDRWLALYADVPTFTVSESTKQDLVDLGFTKVLVVPEGKSVDSPGRGVEKATNPTLLYVGRLKKYKLPQDAIAAYRLVKARVPGARLWIVGDGYMRKRLERHAPAGVTFFGRVEEDEKVALTKQAHILLFPSVREGWGLGVTEANALGVPAIGYDVPGLRDSIKAGSTGILVPPHDVTGMADAAVGLLMNPQRLEDFSQAALAWAAGFNWDATADTMLRHMTHAMELTSQCRPREA